MSAADSNPLVSIVLLACNGKRYIHECARSIVGQRYSHLEIIVVDNGSQDGSVDVLRRSFPDWSYIGHSNNIGFAAGMNSGLGIARGEYVVALNQDVYLDKDFVFQCVDIMKTLPQAGALGTMEYQWADGHLTDKLRSAGPALFLKLRFKGICLKTESPLVESFGVTGSFPFLRRKVLVELEHMDGHIYDPVFFSGWEDLDLWWRMQLRGWPCYATQKTKAWHAGSSFVDEKQSFIAKPTHYQRWVMRNRWFVILKNLPLALLLMLGPVFLVSEIGLFFYLLLRSPRTLTAWIDSWKEVAGSFPNIMLKRRLIQSSRKIPLRQVMGWFKGV